MIKQNQKLVNKGLVIVDALVIIAAFLLTWYIRIHSGIMEVEGGFLSFEEYLIPVLIMIPVYLIIYNFKRLYNTERMVFLSKEIINIIVANLWGIIIFTGLLFVNKQIDYSRSFLVIFLVVSIIFTSLERVIIRLFMEQCFA